MRHPRTLATPPSLPLTLPPVPLTLTPRPSYLSPHYSRARLEAEANRIDFTMRLHAKTLREHDTAMNKRTRKIKGKDTVLPHASMELQNLRLGAKCDCVDPSADDFYPYHYIHYQARAVQGLCAPPPHVPHPAPALVRTPALTWLYCCRRVLALTRAPPGHPLVWSSAAAVRLCACHPAHSSTCCLTPGRSS